MPRGLVIFDCDGVLVDSMGIDIRELARAIAAAGGTLAQDEVRAAFHGVSLAEIERGVAVHLGRPTPPGWLDGWIVARAAAFERELQPVAGAAEALDGVRALGWDACVASQGRIEKMAQTLRLTGLRSHVADERIFSATMVANGKPAPDLFLHAARACGFPADACVVVEDSATGVAAARAAGMRVLAYVADADRAEDGALAERLAALGGEVFHDMAEVPARVAGADARAPRS